MYLSQRFVAASLLAMTAIAAPVFVSTAFADVKVATVDINKVLNASKEAQAERKKLDEMTVAAKKKLEGRRDALKQLEDKLKTQKVTDDSKEAEQFRGQARDFDRMVKDSQEDLQKEFLRSNKELTEKTLNLVKKYAAANKIDLVLDKSDANHGPLLYAGPTFDITDTIARAVNE